MRLKDWLWRVRLDHATATVARARAGTMRPSINQGVVGCVQAACNLFAYFAVGLFYAALAAGAAFLFYVIATEAVPFLFTEVLPVQIDRLGHGMQALGRFIHWLALGS